MSDPLPRSYVVGTWTDPQAFLVACAAARDAGFQGISAFAPFPVHGLETAMGHRPSWIGRAVLAAIAAGAFGIYTFFMQSSVIGWPINVSGKPYGSLTFWACEILIGGLLAGALVNLAACFHACKLVPGDCAVVDPRATDDAFCLVLPTGGDRYSPESLTRWLENHGAAGIVSKAPATEAAHA